MTASIGCADLGAHGSRFISANPDEPIAPWLVLSESDVRIPDQIKTNVVFLGIFDERGIYRPKATGFFVCVKTTFGLAVYLVTAEHVIVGLQQKNYDQVFVRECGSSAKPNALPLDGWYFHPNAENEPTDIALRPVSLSKDGDKVVVFSTNAFVTPEKILEAGWGVGEEVVVVGLFRNHYGQKKNIPIVRVGSLAAMPEEPVKTKWGFVEAYLVELHSVGGLSGSPVYIHSPVVSIKDGRLVSHPGERLSLLGLMQGHFDIPNLREDSIVEDSDSDLGSINTGVGVVIPAYKILETLNQPTCQAERDAIIAKSAASAAKLDFDASENASGGNPTHREDFNSLVSAAARKREPED